MKTEDGKIVFDADEQLEVDRIIQERLARAKAEKPADYEDLKELEKVLEDFDYKGSPKEKAEALKAYREQVKQQEELEKLQHEAEEDGITPAIAKKIKDLESKLEEKTKALDEIVGERQAKKTEEENQKKADEEWNKQVEEFSGKYEDIDLEKLAKDQKFIKFASKRTGTLLEKYEDYIELVGETEAETVAKVMSKELRSTSGGKGNNSGGTYGLTDEQKRTVDEWNKKNPRMQMSYKEFAERSK